jgi:phosphoribosylamine--glycine ligase
MPQLTDRHTPRIMILGIGTFAGAAMRVLKEKGAKVFCYLTRTYGHHGPKQEGETYYFEQHPNPCSLLKEKGIDLVLPMSIDWHQAPWAEEFFAMHIPILSPIKDAMLLERDRDFGRRLCKQYKIPVPNAHVAKNRLEALGFIDAHPLPYVIKNPLCSPTSPIHTIVCETVNDTKSWLPSLDYAEGVFLQEYMGRREVGHIAFVSGGEIYSLVTNQEYKRAFDGNMGPVAGAPLGGLIEADPNDKYGLARDLLQPLLPWFRETGFSGPVQVTAVKRDHKWHVIEYNVRTGVTTGPALWRMLENPLETILAVGRNEKLQVKFIPEYQFACNLTLAGWGYPYTRIEGPRLPVQILQPFDCDVWWNEVTADESGHMAMTGHRIADIIAHAPSMEQAIAKAYENIKKIYCLSSYYRLDVGKSLWPPGEE